MHIPDLSNNFTLELRDCFLTIKNRIVKNNFLKTLCSLIFTVLLFSGCQKITEAELAKENQLSEKDAQNQANTSLNDNNSCRLLSFEQSDGYSENFHYNDKGLADRWYNVFGDGTVNDYHILYNKKDRIKSIQVIFPGDAVNYTFYYNGDQTTRATGYLESTGELYSDILYSYNQRGQMIMQDDIVSDVHSRFYYNNKGYNTRSDFYFGSEMFLSILLKFDISNKNPYLALNGVDFGFNSYTLAPLFGKRWNSTGDFVIYEEGNPIVVGEDDPAQTEMQTGIGNYLTYVKYYDLISESFYDLRFRYENCGPGNENNIEKIPAPTFKKNSPMSVMTSLKKILGSHSKNMKQEFQEFKRQYSSQLKPGKNK